MISNRRNAIGRPLMETLEARALFSASPNLLVSFYGLGGAGGFGNDWLDNITAKVGQITKATVKKYDEDEGGQALKNTLAAIDTNHNHRIDKSEVKALQLRVIGYSFGGIQAANFAQELQAGRTEKGYTIAFGIPIEALVTLDPVQSIIKNTSGIPSNVERFGNYYQQKGGDTTVSLYTQTFNIKLDTISVPDPQNITGGALPTGARKSRQIRIDQGPYADQTVTHQVESEVNGKIEGKNVNHGTVPFYAYDWAISDLTS